MIRNILSTTGSLFILLTFASKAFSQNVESILDKLEKRLEQQEQGVLFFSPQKSKNYEDPLNSATILVLPTPTKITGTLKEAERIKRIASAISKLSNDVDILSSDIKQARQKIIDQSQINNYVEIKTNMLNADQSSMKGISVKIDNYEVLNVSDQFDLLNTNSQYKIYSGPLNPGSHRIDINTRIVKKNEEGLPFNNDVFKTANKSFVINVPNGSFQRAWTLEIVSDEDFSKPIKVNLKEENIK